MMEVNMEDAQQSACVDDCQEALVVGTEENAEPIHLHQHDPHLFLANSSDGLYWQASEMYETQSIPNRNHAEVNSSQSIEFIQNLNFQSLALPSIQQPVIAGRDPNFGYGYSFVPVADRTQPEYLLGFEENIFDHLFSNDYRFASTPSLFGAPDVDNQYAQHDAYSTLGDAIYPQILESEVYAPLGTLAQSQSSLSSPHITIQGYDTQGASLLRGSGSCQLPYMTNSDGIAAMWDIGSWPNESNIAMPWNAPSTVANDGSSGLTLSSEIDSWPMFAYSKSVPVQGELWNNEAYVSNSVALDNWEEAPQTDPFCSHMPEILVETERPTAPIEVEERPHTGSRPRNSLGLSRPVSLPPVRRGGRKRPLTSQEKVIRKEVRKRGSCIRCRTVKEKCHAFIPCSTCLQKSNEIIWSIPCTRFHFLDILETGSYFERVFVSRNKLISKLDEKGIFLQLLVVLSIGQNENLGKIITQLPAPLSIEGVIIWKVAFEILFDLLTNDDYQRKGMSFAERVSTTACLRSKDASLLPPILFSNPEHLGTSCLDCMQAPLAFCLTEFNYSGKPNYGVTEDAISQSLEATLETIAWLSRRQFELTTFQRLQCSANQLFACTKKHPQRQNYNTAKTLFQVLISGSFDNCKVESTNSESNDSGTLLAKAAYTEQKRRIRCDLLRYFETILNKLPSWNYFFEDTIGYGDLDGAELLRGLCSDVDSFDAKTIAYSSVVQDRVTQWLGWEDTFDDFKRYDESELQQDAELDLAWFQSFHRDILRGTPYRSDVNAIETDLDEHYKPLLNSLIRVFEGIVPEMAALLEELMVDLGKLREALPENLKHFEDCTASQEKEAALQNLKARVVECYEWMKDFDNMYERIWMDFGPSRDRSQYPEGPR